jgi:hypothetical protein
MTAELLAYLGLNGHRLSPREFQNKAPEKKMQKNLQKPLDNYVVNGNNRHGGIHYVVNDAEEER